MLLRYNDVFQLQRNIAPDIFCHSPNKIEQTQKYCCCYACEISNHTLYPKAIVQKFPKTVALAPRDT